MDTTLALGLGAGLDGRWVARVTAADVLRVGGAVVVSVGDPSARRVPELAGAAGTKYVTVLSDLLRNVPAPRWIVRAGGPRPPTSYSWPSESSTAPA